MVLSEKAKRLRASLSSLDASPSSPPSSARAVSAGQAKITCGRYSVEVEDKIHKGAILVDVEGVGGGKAAAIRRQVREGRNGDAQQVLCNGIVDEAG